jgi:hypothetical protein
MPMHGERGGVDRAGAGFPTEALPQPNGSVISGSPSGEWEWAALSSDGDAVLAQWSGFVFGSCRTSAAYVMPVEGGTPTPIAGPAPITNRLTSFAMGWTRNDRALVFVPGGGCAGPESARSGVYRFASPGRGTRIASADSASIAQMWGSGVRPRARSAIHLPRELPRRGIAVERHGGVELFSTTGQKLATLPRFSIDRATDRPGHLVVVRGRSRYLVAANGARLVRVSERRAERLRRPDDPSVPLPAPTGSRVAGEVQGQWRWMQRGPNGDTVLAQWSGECEAPTAFLGHGGDLQPVTGERSLRGAPESFAMGWTIDGRAVVLLP